MIVKTKFDIGQYVYTIYDDQVCQLEIFRTDICIAPRYNAKLKCDTVSAVVIYTLSVQDGKKAQRYEEQLFATKEELKESL